ncbi:conserved exported hypothetical protein [Candidatus Terasakiella magnetica]|uniref:Twin-arginine translocation pathway signal n=1 Tax=Candidatus Terasakiella magnetica TaxID=1867952 RepID=A0A1C3RK34_9PROT|nr:DUF1513 domain-containing protein [Candidatus Terasakiella magnetica]SCA57587.1 conserved exported hypothetical protein [Candidatus Terasakiella magnetica]
MHRRTFLKASLGGMSAVAFCKNVNASTLNQGWFSGIKDSADRFGVVHIGADFNVTPLFLTQQRLHGISKHPLKAEVVAPARRPGIELFVFDLNSKKLTTIKAAKGRHFFGHGNYSKDGARYFITESAIGEDKGVVGVYDALNGYERIGEFDSGGVGPHESRISPDGKTLIVSNGGILTHPDTGRAKLNLDTMAPNLSFIDVASGKITKQLSLPESQHKLSMRHMDVDTDGTIYIGLQDQEKGRLDQPLVWKTQGDKLVAMAEPAKGWKIFNGYIGSVCANNGALSVSSPRGNAVYMWSKDENRAYLSEDICAVAKLPGDGFMMTTGKGKIMDVRGREATHGYRFDNHCTPA